MPEPIPARSYAHLPIPQRLEKAHGALQALANDAEIIAAMDPVGYGPTDSNTTAGLALYAAATSATDAQEEGYGEQYVETAELHAARAAAYEAYQRLAAFARAAYRTQPAILKALGVGDFPRRQADQLRRFRQLATMGRKPEYLAGLAPFEVDETAFDDLDDLADAYDEALHEAAGSRAEAQHATHTRDAALDALDAWMLAMHTVAREALKGKPQLLEKLGIIVP